MKSSSYRLRDWFAADIVSQFLSDPVEALLVQERVDQENFYYCGPASIQMLAAVFNVSVSQSAAYSGTRPFMTEPSLWFTDPGAIGGYLAQHSSIITYCTFEDLIYSDIEAPLAKISWEICVASRPVIMLINGGMHWVLVAGFRGKVDNETSAAEVSGLWIADPNRTIKGLQFKPINEQFVNDYFKPVSIAGAWSGKRVLVSGPSSNTFSSAFPARAPRPTGGGSQVTEHEAKELSREDLQYFGLGQARDVLAGGASADQLLVEVLDTTMSYVISPFDVGGRLTWVAFGGSLAQTTDVLLSDVLELPPRGEELVQHLKTLFPHDDVLEVPGFFWTQCLELPTRFNVLSCAEVAGEKVFTDCHLQVYKSLSRFPQPGKLYG